ncbi:hypothetical protein M433DRAFT_263417 [Acidomyces richmondensis BFW]|nr:MAG: hypothetical protein FE78DRAFT_80358 [Acidomyces sp. 'richmondensis']KYG45275.1 hypothetical protein M433DRAFT_263417 [Acidomyces richmondensis BFW]
MLDGNLWRVGACACGCSRQLREAVVLGPGVVANHRCAAATDSEEVVWVTMQLGPMQVRVRGEMDRSRFGCGEIDASPLQSQSQDRSGPAASHARVRHHDWPHRRIEDISLAIHPFRHSNSHANVPVMPHFKSRSHRVHITPSLFRSAVPAPPTFPQSRISSSPSLPTVRLAVTRACARLSLSPPLP